MGFYSWDCKICKHSLRHEGATNSRSRWLSAGVAVTPSYILRGEYNGYGEIGGHQVDEDAAVYHEACFKLVGTSADLEPSEPADDQGHFVGDYDPPQPATLQEALALGEHMTRERTRKGAEAREYMRLKAKEYADRGEPVPEWLRQYT